MLEALSLAAGLSWASGLRLYLTVFVAGLFLTAGAAQARVLVLAIDDVAQSLQVAALVREHFPQLQIVARARNVTHFYRLRKLGIARWPLLWNVLKGDFSVVGPRAEMPRYVGVYPPALRKVVLSVKPGLVDLSSRELGAECALLAGLEGDALEEAYVEKVLPRRLELGKQYVEGRGFWMDLRILARCLAGPLLR